MSESISRNAPCPCGSGKKYKMCCGAEAVAAERRAESEKSPFWHPEGSELLKDSDAYGPDDAMWRKEYFYDEKETTEVALAEKIVSEFVVPFVERHCDDDFVDEESLILLETAGARDDAEWSQSPWSRICNGKDWAKALVKNITSFLEDYHNIEFDCLVRREMSFGTPIVEIDDYDGSGLTLAFTIPDKDEED